MPDRDAVAAVGAVIFTVRLAPRPRRIRSSIRVERSALGAPRFDLHCGPTPCPATPYLRDFRCGYAHTLVRGNAGDTARAGLGARSEPPTAPRRGVPSLWGLGEQITWVTGLVLALSALTGWYSGQGEGVTVSVIGWNTGVLGKLVFLIGVLAILVVGLRRWGIDLPAAVPESLVVIALGALSTIFVLVRAISIPDEFFFAGRGIGLWISLVASVALIGAGLLQASEEL